MKDLKELYKTYNTLKADRIELISIIEVLDNDVTDYDPTFSLEDKEEELESLDELLIEVCNKINNLLVY